MSSYRYIDAKISNFIHRKLATIGDVTNTSNKRETASSGIYYEQLALPSKRTGVNR